MFSLGQLAAGAQSDGGPAVLCWACGLPSPLPSAHALCLRCLCLTARVLCPRTQADTCGGAADQAWCIIVIMILMVPVVS